MKTKFYRDYTGSSILEISEDAYQPIVESIIYKNDMSLLIGKYKSNKSIFAMQLACSISSGRPFLGTFDVPDPGVVWYFATEGKDNDVKDRFLRMSKCIPTNFDNILLVCSTQVKFNTENGKFCMNELMERHKDKLPNLIIIDSLYSGFKGTLVKDDQVNEFLTTIRHFAEFCNDAAVLMTHHMTKEQKDSEGRVIRQTDSNAYGSVFLLGQVDSAFTIERCGKQKEDRIVRCETERSGKTVEDMRVRFHEPEPLYLSLVSNHLEEENRILKLLAAYSDGLTANEMLKLSKIKKSLLYIVLGELKEKDKVVKPKGYSGKYLLKQGVVS